MCFSLGEVESFPQWKVLTLKKQWNVIVMLCFPKTILSDNYILEKINKGMIR